MSWEWPWCSRVTVTSGTDVSHPLIIAALVLAGVSAAGLFVDARAAARRATRTFGISAIVIKLVLAVGFVVQLLSVRVIRGDVFHEWGTYLTFLSLVAVGVPLVGAAIACELAALPRLGERDRSDTHSARTTDQATSEES